MPKHGEVCYRKPIVLDNVGLPNQNHDILQEYCYIDTDAIDIESLRSGDDYNALVKGDDDYLFVKKIDEVGEGFPDNYYFFTEPYIGMGFLSTNGADVGAYRWVFTQDGWRVSYGDTGWFFLTALHDDVLAQDPNAKVAVRRVNDKVQIAVKCTLDAGGGTIAFLEDNGLPDGFRPIVKNPETWGPAFRHFDVNATEEHIFVVVNNNLVWVRAEDMDGVNQPTRTHNLMLDMVVAEYGTQDAWPTNSMHSPYPRQAYW